MQSLRKPSLQEERLLRFLIQKASIKLPTNWNKDLLVKPMNDGGMRSLLLFPNGAIRKNRLFGKRVSEHLFTDKDGVKVLASLNVDDKRALFELDIWKVNFSPLISMPEPC